MTPCFQKLCKSTNNRSLVRVPVAKQVYVPSGPVQITTPKPKELSSLQNEPASVSTLTEPPKKRPSAYCSKTSLKGNPLSRE